MRVVRAAWRRPNRFLVARTLLCVIALVPMVERLRAAPTGQCYAWCGLDGPMAALAIPLLVVAWGVLSVAYVVVWRATTSARRE